MNCNVCKCKTCKYNNGCEYPAYYNCGHYVPNNENNIKTNGEVIKALFPKTLIYVDTTLKLVWFCIYEDKQDEDFDRHITFPLDWWNAPYKKGETNERQ